MNGQERRVTPKKVHPWPDADVPAPLFGAEPPTHPDGVEGLRLRHVQRAQGEMPEKRLQKRRTCGIMGANPQKKGCALHEMSALPQP